MDIKKVMENLTEELYNEGFDHGNILAEHEENEACESIHDFIEKYDLMGKELDFSLMSNDSIYKNLLTILYGFLDNSDKYYNEEIISNAQDMIFWVEEKYIKAMWNGYIIKRINIKKLGNN